MKLALNKKYRDLMKGAIKCGWAGYYEYSFWAGAILIEKMVTPNCISSVPGLCLKSQTSYKAINNRGEFSQEFLIQKFEQGRKIKFKMKRNEYYRFI